MYLMYVDESGDIGLVNSPTRYFVLVGLVLHELRWQQTREALVQQLAPSSYIRRKAGQNYFNRLDPIICKGAAPRTGGIVRL